MALIMVVDDSMIIRKQLTMALTKKEYTVVEAASAAAAIDLARSPEPISLIISDVNMPGMNGLDMVAEIRAIPEHAKTPILMLTTESTEHLQKEGMEKGASAWIVKPFNEEQLLAGIAHFLSPKDA